MTGTEDMSRAENIRLQESTLLHLQSQGDKSENVYQRHVEVCAPHCVNAPEYYKYTTVQM